MSYVINVSLAGQRLFSTNRGSCKTAEHTHQVYTEIKARFPEAEGFGVEVYNLSTTAAKIDPAVLTLPVLDDPSDEV